VAPYDDQQCEGIYPGNLPQLPKKNLQAYLNEFCYRFSRRKFGADLFNRLAIAMVASPVAESKGEPDQTIYPERPLKFTICPDPAFLAAV
jgi:hypothetical protein